MTDNWGADASTATSSVPSAEFFLQMKADRTGRPIEEIRAEHEREAEIERAAAAEREATFARALEMMSPAEAFEAIRAMATAIDDYDGDLYNAPADLFRRFERALEIVEPIIGNVVRTIAPIVERATETSWLVDSIADVLDNGSGNTADEREAALDVVEMMIQARMRVFAALGLTQRHLVKGSEITEERTVWVDQ